MFIFEISTIAKEILTNVAINTVSKIISSDD